jgi:hypothetical protein
MGHACCEVVAMFRPQILGMSVLSGSWFASLPAILSQGASGTSMTDVILMLVSGTSIIGLILQSMDKRAERRASQVEKEQMQRSKDRDGEVAWLRDWCRSQEEKIGEMKTETVRREVAHETDLAGVRVAYRSLAKMSLKEINRLRVQLKIDPILQWPPSRETKEAPSEG